MMIQVAFNENGVVTDEKASQQNASNLVIAGQEEHYKYRDRCDSVIRGTDTHLYHAECSQQFLGSHAM